MTRRSTEWHRYQEDAAAFFRTLGLDASVDVPVIGARGKHAVDVLVKLNRSGVEQRWIVECKHRKRAVEKAHVLTLQEIVSDTGADRGIMLSEKGFQAGAVQCSRNSNITLTSLKELREDSRDERLKIELGAIRRRLATVSLFIDEISHDALSPDGSTEYTRLDPEVEEQVAYFVMTTLSIARAALDDAELDIWPTTWGLNPADREPQHAQPLSELVAGLDDLLRSIESWITETRAEIAKNS